MSGFRLKNFNNGTCKSLELAEIRLFEAAEVLYCEELQSKVNDR